MKKGAILALIIILLAVSFVSASYICSDGGVIQEDNREIKMGGTKTINGLLLGLADADESAAMHRMSVELIIDAQLVTLTNESPSILMNFTDSKSYIVSLVNSTESEASINVDGTNRLMEKGDIVSGENLEISLISLQGAYPGTANVKVMVGRKRVSLSNQGNITEIATVYGREYLIELFSASDIDSTIKVKKCNNESAKFVYIADSSPDENEIQNNTDNNLNDTNNTLNQTNETNMTNYTSNQSGNYSFNQTNSSQGNQNNSQNGEPSERTDLIQYIALGGLAISAVIFLILLFRYIKNKSNKGTNQ